MDATLKFQSADFTGQDIAGLPDVPSEAGFTAAQLKARFDNIGKALIALGKHNDLVDALSSAYGAAGIGTLDYDEQGTGLSVQDSLDALWDGIRAAANDLAASPGASHVGAVDADGIESNVQAALDLLSNAANILVRRVGYTVDHKTSGSNSTQILDTDVQSAMNWLSAQ